MNYIRHLTAAMERFASDNRLNPTHVSLYLALFQYWNLARFKNPVSISRDEIMRLSKIGSKVTYHRCIKDLHNWSYLQYDPSHNPFKGSHVYMFNFCTSSEQAQIHSRSKNGQVLEQAVVPSKTIETIKNHKQNKRPSLQQVKDFFEKMPDIESHTERSRDESLISTVEAEKFYNYYSATGWKIGKSNLEDWEAAARNWIIKTNENPLVQNRDNLNATTDKNYDQPL